MGQETNVHQYEVTLNSVDGSPFPIPHTDITMWTLNTSAGSKKTMSGILAGKMGETLTVEEYTNDKGKTYIRPPKNSSHGGGSGGSASSGDGSDSYADGQAVGHAISNGVRMAIAKAQSPAQISICDIEDYANQIMDLSDKLKAERKASHTPETSPQDDGQSEPPWNQPSPPAPPEPPPQPPQPPVNKPETGLAVCIDLGISSRVEQAGMPEKHLDAMLLWAKGNKILFKETIIKQLESKGC